MKCPNCGEELSDGVLFCRECGCKIQREPAKRFCRECGSELESGSKFCSTCGAKVLTQEDIEIVPVDETPDYEDETDIVTVEQNASNAQPSAGYFQQLWNKLDGYLKFCVITAAFLLFTLLIACVAHKPIALLVSIVQIGCLVASGGIRLGLIKTDKKWLCIVLPLIILVMFSPYFGDFKAKSDNTAVVETSVPENTTVATTVSATETTAAETKYVLADDEISIDFSKYDLTVENYEDVTYRLSNLGFENISYRIQYDIVLGITKEGEVASVSIAGRTDYKKGDIFKKGDPVVITYHMKSEDGPNKKEESSKAETTLESTLPSTVEANSNQVVETTELITETEKVTSLDWADPLFSFWTGRCSKLEKMIKNNMNDPKSFDEISTKRYDIIDEDDKKTVNDLLTTYNISGQVEINDVLILCEFTGKNKLGGTVKNTAIAVARYSTQTLEIIGFE